MQMVINHFCLCSHTIYYGYLCEIKGTVSYFSRHEWMLDYYIYKELRDSIQWYQHTPKNNEWIHVMMLQSFSLLQQFWDLRLML